MDFTSTNIIQLIDSVEQFLNTLKSKRAKDGSISIQESELLLFISKYEQDANFVKLLIKDLETRRKAERSKKFGSTSEQSSALLPGLPEEVRSQLAQDPSGDEGQDQNAADDADDADDADANERKAVNGRKRTRRRSRKTAGFSAPGRSFSSQHPEWEVVVKTILNVKQCPVCGGKTTISGYWEKEYLVYKPASVYILRVRFPKWRCMTCQTSGRVSVRDGDEPVLIKNSPVSVSLLLFIITQKFMYHIPCNRIEAMLRSYRVLIRRNQIATWLIKVSRRLEPLYQLMLEVLRTNRLMNMDETRLLVHREPGRNNTTKSYLWLAIGRETHLLAVFVYAPSRGADVIETILGPGWSGSLQTDGYGAYDSYIINNGGVIIHMSCLAHIRRKFVNYLKDRKLSKNDPIPAIVALCNDIFREHAAIARREGLSPEEIIRLKNENIAPLLDKLETRLHAALENLPPAARTSMPYAKDIRYALSQLPGQRSYLNDPIAAPDNNICERVIKHVATGRKNWLFADSPDGAKAIAIFASLIISARFNRIDPVAYLDHVLRNITKADSREALEALLPGNVPLPRMDKTVDLEPGDCFAPLEFS